MQCVCNVVLFECFRIVVDDDDDVDTPAEGVLTLHNAVWGIGLPLFFLCFSFFLSFFLSYFLSLSLSVCVCVYESVCEKETRAREESDGEEFHDFYFQKCLKDGLQK